MIIYVGNLSNSITVLELTDIFSKYGNVSQVSLFVDNFLRQFTSYGLVNMPNNEQALTAMKALKESSFNGRNINLHKLNA